VPANNARNAGRRSGAAESAGSLEKRSLGRLESGTGEFTSQAIPSNDAKYAKSLASTTPDSLKSKQMLYCARYPRRMAKAARSD
jgi:hypothetical protein